MRKVLLSLSLFCAATYAAQAVTVTGTVQDDSGALPGASVMIKGTDEGTEADDKGNFSLEVKPGDVLEIEYLGYVTQTYTIPAKPKKIKIVMKEDGVEEIKLDVKVVTTQPYGGTGGVVGASTTLGTKALESATGASVDNALQGRVPGVTANSTSGQPGAASTIRIRGGNSITGGNEPLYVIDGFIVYNDQSATQTGAQNAEAHLDPLSFLNPADIESIEILKDVSATAIYGSRGANGVIMITTKKGQKGKSNISYSGNFGFSSIGKRLDMLDAWQFTEVYNEIRTNENSGALLPTPTKSYDWQDAALQTAFQQDHQLSIIGGDDQSRFTISGGYKGQDGIILGTDYSRYSGRVNYERDLFKNLRAGVNANGAWARQRGLASGGSSWAPNSWIEALTMAPIVPIYNEDGSYNYEQNIFSQSGTNPISDLEHVENVTENVRLIATGFLQYEPIKHLKLRASIGADLNHTRQKYYAPSNSTQGVDQGGVARQGQLDYNTWQSEITADYSHTLAEKHALSYLIGYTTQASHRSGFSASTYGYANDNLTYNSLGSAANYYQPQSSAYVSTLTSWLARVNYSFDDRYNVTATLRADGSSRFAEDHRWGVFPSIGASWNLDQESWIHLSPKVDYLQLRLSAGVVGNQEIGDYQYASNIVPGTYFLGGKSVAANIIANMANPDLKWETTKEWNFGIDYGFLNNRIHGSVDYYIKTTDDLLYYYNVPVPPNLYGYTLANVGSMRNTGIEFMLTGEIFKTKDFDWESTVTLSHNANKLLSLSNELYETENFQEVGGVSDPISVSTHCMEVGHTLGDFYGLKFVGYDKEGFALVEASDGNGGWTVKQFNANLNTRDNRQRLGNGMPKVILGWNNSFRYRDFDLSMQFTGQFGYKILNAMRCFYENNSIGYNRLKSAADLMPAINPDGTPVMDENGEQLKVRRSSAMGQGFWSEHLENGDFLKLSNVTLGYNIPMPKAMKNYISRVRVYGSATNLFCITGYSGIDPEVSNYFMSPGIDDRDKYPTTRSYTVGLSINF